MLVLIRLAYAFVCARVCICNLETLSLVLSWDTTICLTFFHEFKSGTQSEIDMS